MSVSRIHPEYEPSAVVLTLVPREGKAVVKPHRVWLSLAAAVVTLGLAALGVRLASGEQPHAHAQPLPPVTVTSVVYLPEMRTPVVPVPAGAPTVFHQPYGRS